MKTTIRILAVIAVFQAALIAATWRGEARLKSHIQGSTLLTFNKSDIDTIIIKDNENEVRLQKKDGTWRTLDGFPADQQKAETLLGKLAELKYSLPVTTSSLALSRFKVAEDDFDRYLQLQNNNKTLAELYLGTGAGARQSHVRSGEQESVYSVAIGSYDLPATQDAWQNKEILQFDKKDVTTIELDDVKLLREPGEDKKEKSLLWQGESLSADTTVNQQAVNEGLTKLAGLRFNKLLGREEQPEYGISKPLLTLKLLFTNGNRVYSFGKMSDSEEICLKVSDRDEYFQLASHLAKPILEQFVKDTLLVTDAAPAEKETAEAEKP